tara:strand:- start:210 stop:476 length:267 start_codon:yes stop_codon:yes gene_type:complete
MSEKKTYRKLTPTQKLVVVNSRLRHGDMSKVAKKTGFSSSTVSSVLEGRTENERVLNIAYDITRGRKKNFQVIKELAYRKTLSSNIEA